MLKAMKLLLEIAFSWLRVSMCSKDAGGLNNCQYYGAVTVACS